MLKFNKANESHDEDMISHKYFLVFLSSLEFPKHNNNNFMDKSGVKEMVRMFQSLMRIG